MAKDKPYLEAEKKIEEALKSGATGLDLSNEYDTPDEKKLTELPESIGKLKQLTSLKLSHNKLTALPDSLGQLTQLQTLNPSSNQLTALPDSLGQLTQLQTLDLSDNQLTTLPESLGQLMQLQELHLSDNQLTTLPESLLSQLTQLTELDLSNNQLTTLPESLGQLILLKMLRVSDNLLIRLPKSFRQLNLLETLNISGNKFTELPEFLKALDKLRELWLGGNQLTTLPNLIGELNNLISLGLGFTGNKNKYGGNPFNQFPESIRRITALQKLWVINCGLNSLPNWIDELNQLTILNVRENKLRNLPDSIGKLINLKDFYLTDNLLLDLPLSLAQIELKTLSLDGNPLNPALQSVYNAGLDELKAYLRSLAAGAEPLYEAKLVLVGEGNVGKTTLLKALKGKAGEAPQEHEPTTHGVEIDIHGLRLPHPAKNGVEIQLNAWDFGGQDVYRVTHQFFFSRRSLYLLVWEPRRGVQQCQVEDWLNMIRLRVGDEARVIIVST